jgi:CII-binding regulator of phage lambda lysogenization HflD
MTIELTNEEKIGVVDSHLKNIYYNKYNLDLALIEENAKATPDADAVEKINNNIQQLSNQIAALEAEKDSLN